MQCPDPGSFGSRQQCVCSWSDIGAGVGSGAYRQRCESQDQFKPEAGGASITQTLPAAPAALILISGSSISAPTVWESEFDCASADGSASDDPLAFVETASPPAVSLLVPEPDASDAPVQAALTKLRNSCGATVPAKATLGQFGLADIVTAVCPQNLPVRCPS